MSSGSALQIRPMTEIQPDLLPVLFLIYSESEQAANKYPPAAYGNTSSHGRSTADSKDPVSCRNRAYTVPILSFSVLSSVFPDL